jgi:hypothetical protein
LKEHSILNPAFVARSALARASVITDQLVYVEDIELQELLLSKTKLGAGESLMKWGGRVGGGHLRRSTHSQALAYHLASLLPKDFGTPVAGSAEAKRSILELEQLILVSNPSTRGAPVRVVPRARRKTVLTKGQVAAGKSLINSMAEAHDGRSRLHMFW